MWIFCLKIDFENWKSLNVLNQDVLQDVKKTFKEAHLNAKIYCISSTAL